MQNHGFSRFLKVPWETWVSTPQVMCRPKPSHWSTSWTSMIPVQVRKLRKSCACKEERDSAARTCRSITCREMRRLQPSTRKIRGSGLGLENPHTRNFHIGTGGSKLPSPIGQREEHKRQLQMSAFSEQPPMRQTKKQWGTKNRSDTSDTLPRKSPGSNLHTQHSQDDTLRTPSQQAGRETGKPREGPSVYSAPGD